MPPYAGWDDSINIHLPFLVLESNPSLPTLPHLQSFETQLKIKVMAKNPSLSWGQDYIADYVFCNWDCNDEIQAASDFISTMPLARLPLIIASGNEIVKRILFTTPNRPVVLTVSMEDPQAAGTPPGRFWCGLTANSPTLMAPRLNHFLNKHSVTNIGVISDPNGNQAGPPLKGALKVAKPPGVTLHFLDEDVPSGCPAVLQPQLDRADALGCDALMTLGDAFCFNNRRAIAQFANTHKPRLPLMGTARQHKDAGATDAYGPDYKAMYENVVDFVVDTWLTPNAPINQVVQQVPSVDW